MRSILYIFENITSNNLRITSPLPTILGTFTATRRQVKFGQSKCNWLETSLTEGYILRLQDQNVDTSSMISLPHLHRPCQT